MIWDIVVNVLASIFLISGLFFFVVGVIGLIRMPDVFCRLHATTNCDTLGAGLIFVGLILWQGFTFISLNLALVILFIWLTNPTAAHYIAKSEYLHQKQKVEKGE